MAFSGASGEEANKQKLFVGKAGSGESGEKGGGTRNGDNGDLGASAKRDEAIAWVADEGHACVRDEGDFGTLLHGEDEFGRAGHFVVFVIGDERLRDFVVGEEFLGVASVFAGDLVGLFENAEGAEGDVFQIADGS